jgi:hypothetical protein
MMRAAMTSSALLRTSLLLALLIAGACSSGDDDSPSPADDDDAAVDEDRELPDLSPDDGGGGSAGSAGEGDAASGAGGNGGNGGAGGEEPQDGGDDPSDAMSGDAAAVDSGGGATCVPTGTVEHEHTSEAASHIDEALPASEYNSSPPSSGPHCNTWGEYASYGASRPLPACNFIHNLEHGAIVLLYNCPDGCTEITDVLGGILADPPTDPDCIAPRLVLTPYQEMDAKVAAVAWGFTWTSDCMDAAARDSLETFIAAHIGSRGAAPEPTICGNGGFSP